MADLKEFAEQLVNLTVKEVNELAEILKEVSQFCPQLLITGGKYLTGWKKFKSKNLPLHLTNKIGEATKVMVVGGGP